MPPERSCLSQGSLLSPSRKTSPESAVSCALSSPKVVDFPAPLCPSKASLSSLAQQLTQERACTSPKRRETWSSLICSAIDCLWCLSVQQALSRSQGLISRHSSRQKQKMMHEMMADPSGLARSMPASSRMAACWSPSCSKSAERVRSQKGQRSLKHSTKKGTLVLPMRMRGSTSMLSMMLITPNHTLAVFTFWKRWLLQQENRITPTPSLPKATHPTFPTSSAATRQPITSRFSQQAAQSNKKWPSQQVPHDTPLALSTPLMRFSFSQTGRLMKAAAMMEQPCSSIIGLAELLLGACASVGTASLKMLVKKPYMRMMRMFMLYNSSA